MRSPLRRGGVALAGTAALVGSTVALAPSANAEPIWTLNHNASVTTDVAKAGRSVTFSGSQVSTIDIGRYSDNVTADLKLGQGQLPVDIPLGPIKIPGVGTATLQIEPIGKAKGSFDSGNIDVTQKFNIHVVKVTPLKLGGPNLVGNNCRSASPVSLNLKGKLTGLFDPFTLSGTFTIPKFANCGLLTSTVSSLTSGPGNTAKATFTPQ